MGEKDEDDEDDDENKERSRAKEGDVVEAARHFAWVRGASPTSLDHDTRFPTITVKNQPHHHNQSLKQL